MSETKEIYNINNNESEDIRHKKEQEKLSLDSQQILYKNQSVKYQKTAENIKADDQSHEQQMPDKFYDSDLASVNEKDFLSDNQPPKDIAQQRKLLHKQKTLHIYKTILRVGLGIDKPAPFDQIKLRYAQQTEKGLEGVKKAKQISFIQNTDFIVYNLGKEYSEIQRLVTSMRKGEIATFQLEELEVSKKSNIKVLKNRQLYTIQVQTWITVIDIDGNKDMLKYLLRRGQGPNRVIKYDQVTYQASISYKQVILLKQNFDMLKIQQETIDNMHPIIWKILCTMKRNQFAKINLTDQDMQKLYKIGQISQTQKNQENKQFQQSNHIPKKYAQLLKTYNQNSQSKNNIYEIQQKQGQIQNKAWQIIVQVKNLISIDDIFMNGTVLKKMLIKGVSTAKPESASLIYYALKFLDPNKKVLHEDPCFNSDWWEDYGKLDILGCRKNYLDQFKLSQFLKNSMKRMKPAEVSEIQCRDMSLFTYGNDYQELKKLWPAQQEFPPQRIFMVVRVYNFTEGKNCFNTDIDQKVEQSKRKKIIAVKLLNQGKIQQTYKRFQNIISFYNAGNINQDGYNQKISALMNSILCLFKQNKFSQMIPLCNMVLQKPRHGFNQDKMKINAQGIKLQGKSPNNEEGQQTDSREVADLQQNQKIIDKCLYRKALALLKTGQSKKALECLQNIKDQNVQVKTLKQEAEKHLQNYEQKSKKMFKNMFQKA